jgi:ribosome assembly protein RRB1
LVPKRNQSKKLHKITPKMSHPIKRKSGAFDEGSEIKTTQKAQRLNKQTSAARDMNDDSDDDGIEYNDDEYSDDDEVIVAGDDDNEQEEEEEDGEAQSEKARVWRHGIDKLQDGEVLEHDPAAYKVYETAQLEWPALSFDILETPGEANYKISYPATIFAVCGTQTDGAQNKVNVLLMENVCESKVQNDDDDDDDGGFDMEGKDDDEHESSLEPILTYRSFFHTGVVNRIKAMPQNQRIIATFSDDGTVSIWDINLHLQSLRQQYLPNPPEQMTPIYTFKHDIEGFGMAWSPCAPLLATGDRNGNIYLHSVIVDGDKITVSTLETPYSRQSPGNWIEAIEWSPSQPNVFATADTQGYVCIWRTGIPSRVPFGQFQAHQAEINTLSWNKTKQRLLATGDDNGVIKVWDIKYIKTPEHLLQATYSYHKKAITSLQWHPHEESMLVAASEDDSTTVWDFSNEADQNEIANEATGAQMIDYEIPGQLLFQHLGQQEVKEVIFHPQFSSLILSTASTGIDIYKPSNLDVIIADPNAQPSEEIRVD